MVEEAGCPSPIAGIVKNNVRCTSECRECEPCVIIAENCRFSPGKLMGRRILVYRGHWSGLGEEAG